MGKPNTVLISEFRNNIENVINNSGLPWWKIKDELEYVFLPGVRTCCIKEEQVEREEYNKELEKAENEKSGGNEKCMK